ncbi:MAG: Beta,4-mannooligosaccharide phosphorylase [Myxococcaceae bacterium]|nr:Beta,4-mannooligosaccharide phosphorylase [Myxococcaceae bacterium]
MSPTPPIRRSYETLFKRHLGNPILTAEMWPYPAHTVFNAGATRLEDGTTLLLVRVEDRTGQSHLTAARSKNGIDEWIIDAQPTLAPDPVNHPEEIWGIEDPRITWLSDLGQYAIAYTAFSTSGPGVSLALTKDFKTFERKGLVMQPDDKDAALLPHKIDGNFAMIHRPVNDHGAHIWISYSPDLENWGQHKMMLRARKGSWWDANKIGLSPPLIETPRGWLMLYHGVRNTCAGSLYRLGLALFALDKPEVCLLRGDEWIFAPQTEYEKTGDVDNVAFPCGFTIGADGDTINLYYGAADTSMALATGSIKALLEWLDQHGRPPPAVLTR